MPDPWKAFDNNNLNSPTVTAKAECQIGMAFSAGFVGMISQVKFFMNNMVTTANYDGKLKFQGSNDNTTYTDIFTAT